VAAYSIQSLFYVCMVQCAECHILHSAPYTHKLTIITSAKHKWQAPLMMVV